MSSTDAAHRARGSLATGSVAQVMARPADQGGFFYAGLIALLVLITVGLLIVGLPGHSLGG